MATGMDPLSVGSESEPFYNCSYSPCSKDGRRVEAATFYVQCDENFCSTCQQFHNKFEVTKGHQVLDNAGIRSRSPYDRPPLPKEICSENYAKTIKIYCDTHDLVCCTMCIAVSHRVCQCVTYIPKVANGSKKTPEVQNVTEAIKTTKLEMEKLKKIRHADLNNIEKEKGNVLTNIKLSRDRITKHLDYLEKKAMDELQTKYQKVKNQINTDLKDMEEIILSLETKMTELQTFEGDNESQLLEQIKQANSIRKKGDMLRKKMENSIRNEDLKINFISKIADNICNLKSLGEFTENALFQSTRLRSRYNVRDSSEKSTCTLTGVCLLPNGTMIITDRDNEKVKHLSASYDVITSCNLPGSPANACTTGYAEVAITLWEKKIIQFASVSNKISLTRSFFVGDLCRGLVFSEGKLFVTCKESVRVYDLSGFLVGTIQNDTNGHRLFLNPLRIAASTCGTFIHVTDSEKGVLTIDKTGHRRCTFKEPELKHALGVCAADDNSLFVCGYKSHNIFHVDRSGKESSILLCEQDCITSPYALCYDKANSRLIVTIENSDDLYVYNLSH